MTDGSDADDVGDKKNDDADDAPNTSISIISGMATSFSKTGIYCHDISGEWEVQDSDFFTRRYSTQTTDLPNYFAKKLHQMMSMFVHVGIFSPIKNRGAHAWRLLVTIG